jgi:hypothetical protein
MVRFRLLTCQVRSGKEGARPVGRPGPHGRQGRPAGPVAGVRLGLAGWASFRVKKENGPWPVRKYKAFLIFKFANYFEFTSNSIFEYFLLAK